MKLLDKLTLGAVGAVAAYYLGYLLLCLLGFDARVMTLFALFVIALVTLPVCFRARLETKLGRAFKVLKIAFCSLLYIYIVTVIAFWCYIGFDGAKTAETYAAQASEDDGSDTLVIVFGCRTYGNEPGDTLKLRLDEAYELLEALPSALCIVSGGQGSNEILPEATTMKRYLVSRGVDPDRIIEEPNSHTTSENVRLSRQLAEELGLENRRLIAVSTAFHLPRIEKLSARYWRPMEVCAAESPNPARYYVSMVREYLSYIKMTLFDKAVFNV